MDQAIPIAVICRISRHDGDACQATATGECRPADARHAVRNRDAGQATALEERRISDARHAVRDCETMQATASPERIIADARTFTIVGKCYACQTHTIVERPITDTCYAIWNRDICQTTAVNECASANAFYILWNIDTFQFITLKERFLTDFRHSVW